MDPKDTYALLYRAKICEKTGNNADAVEYYKKILTLEPRNKDAILGIVDLYANKINDVNAALKILEEAIERDPDEAIYWFKKAEIVLKQGNEEEALKCLEKAIEIDMMLADAWIKRAEIYEKRGELNSAAESYNALTKIRSSDPNAWYMRAKFMARIGKKKDALKFVDKALKLDPSFTLAQQLKKELS